MFNVDAEGEPKLLGVWVGSFIIKQISLFFLNRTNLIEELCKHHRNQEKEYNNLWQ